MFNNEGNENIQKRRKNETLLTKSWWFTVFYFRLGQESPHTSVSIPCPKKRWLTLFLEYQHSPFFLVLLEEPSPWTVFAWSGLRERWWKLAGNTVSHFCQCWWFHPTLPAPNSSVKSLEFHLSLFTWSLSLLQGSAMSQRSDIQPSSALPGPSVPKLKPVK